MENIFKRPMTWTRITRPYYDRNGLRIFLGFAEDLYWHMKDGIFGAIVLDPPFTITDDWCDGRNASEQYMHMNDMWRLLKPDGYVIALTNPTPGVIVIPRNGKPHHQFMPELKPQPLGCHPHSRPVTELKSLLFGLSAANGPVLDPFMGSGATLLAAQELGLHAVGIEMEERYCEQAATLLHWTGRVAA